jgi:hypothetical protein
VRDIRKELEEFDGATPVSWVPTVGAILVGQVARYDSGTTHFGTYPICVVYDEETGQEVSVWIFHQVLLDEFRKRRPKVGERVGIKRLPDGQTAEGQRYRRYAVRVDREEEPVPDLTNYSPPSDMAPPEIEREAEPLGQDYLPF